MGFDAEYTTINLFLLLQSPSDGSLPLASYVALPLVLIPRALLACRSSSFAIAKYCRKITINWFLRISMHSTMIWPAASLRLRLFVLIPLALVLEPWHRLKLVQLLSLLLPLVLLLLQLSPSDGDIILPSHLTINRL